MEKICPCCSRSFICRNDNILECWCIEKHISAPVRQCLSLNFKGCLCPDCIDQINNNFDKTDKPINSVQNEKV